MSDEYTAGEVTTYYLTPEEIERRYGKPKDSSKIRPVDYWALGYKLSQIASKTGVSYEDLAPIIQKYEEVWEVEKKTTKDLTSEDLLQHLKPDMSKHKWAKVVGEAYGFNYSTILRRAAELKVNFEVEKAKVEAEARKAREIIKELTISEQSQSVTLSEDPEPEVPLVADSSVFLKLPSVLEPTPLINPTLDFPAQILHINRKALDFPNITEALWYVKDNFSRRQIREGVVKVIMVLPAESVLREM